MLTAIFSQPRSDGVHSSKMVNRILQSLFAARKLNYIIMYIRHYKILKKQRKLQLYIQYIASQRQIKGKLVAAYDLNFVQKIWYWVLTPSEARKMIEWMNECVLIYRTDHISWSIPCVFIYRTDHISWTIPSWMSDLLHRISTGLLEKLDVLAEWKDRQSRTACG